MASRTPTGKVYVGIKVPDKNYDFLQEIVDKDGGSMAGYINEAIQKWLQDKGYDAEAAIDHRTGKWVRVKDLSNPAEIKGSE